MITKLFKFADFRKTVSYLARKFNLGSFPARMAIDALPRTEYAYCLYHAAMQAKMLGIDHISALEFGVAGGNGLIALENHSLEIERITGVKIDIYGFDTAQGMPEADDYRDLPYIWEKGFFKMDFDALQTKLKKSVLVIGNVKDTVGDFTEKFNPAPIGFISFDLDYYSSTVNALGILKFSDKYFLPRVFCYFDDCIGDDWELHSEFTGELLAISEFNDNNNDMKLGKLYGLQHKRLRPSYWNDEIFVLHRFSHNLYNRHIYPDKNWQLKLR